MFWHLTPRMVDLIATAARHRLEQEHNGRAWLAWQIERLSREKRLPRFDTLTIKRRPREQTWQEQMAICRQLAIYYGGTITNG
jgi:hypothetical protein